MSQTLMGSQFIPLVVVASLAFGAACMHGHLYLRRHQFQAHLLLALCCMAIAVYAAGFATQLCLTDHAWVLQFDHVQMLAVTVFVPCLIWFIHMHIRWPANWFLWMLTVGYGVLFLTSLVGPQRWTLAPEVHQGWLMNYPFSDPTPYLEVKEQGPIGKAQILWHGLSILYTLGLCFRYVVKNPHPRAFLLAFTILMVCLAGANDIAVINGWIRSLYSTVYVFLLMVLFMGHAMVLEVVEAARLKDVLKEKSERIQLALGGGRLAFWDWYPGSDRLQIHRLDQEPGSGRESFVSLSSDWNRIIVPEDQAMFNAVFRDQARVGQDRLECAVRLDLGASDRRWILIQGMVFERTEQGDPIRISGTMVDITQTKRYQEAHRESERRALALLEGVAAHLFIVVYDVQGRVRLNRGAGLNPEGEEGGGWSRLTVHDIEPALTAEAWRHRAEILGQGQVLIYQTDFRHPGRGLIPVEARASTILWGGETMFLVVARDISLHKLSERRLNELAEAERQKIGEELHDGIGQFLTAISYRTRRLLKHAIERQWPCVKEVEEVVNLAGLLTQETRLLSRSLQAVHLVERGLLPAIQELLEFYRQQFDVACLLHWDPHLSTMEKSRELHVYRFLQEAMNNAFKHGAASQITIRLSLDQGRVRVEVANTGREWVASSEGPVGMGLENMRRRVLLLDGELQVEHPAEGGVRLICQFPYVPQEKEGSEHEAEIG